MISKSVSANFMFRVVLKKNIHLFLLAIAVCVLVYLFETNTETAQNNVTNKNSLILTQSTSTQSLESIPLTVHDLYANPEKFDGKRLTIRGYYLDAHEQVVLTYSIVADVKTGYRGVSTEKVWAVWKGNPGQALREKLNKIPGIGRHDYFGQVEVEGTFHIVNIRAGEGDEKRIGAGHLGQYKYSFTIDKISVFDEATKRYVPITKTKGGR